MSVMYQRKFRLEFRSIFVAPVEEFLAKRIAHLINSTEYSLWKKYLDGFPEAKDIDLIHRYLETHLNCEGVKELDQISFPPQVVVELLDCILTFKINELLMVPTQHHLEEKPEPIIPSVTFQEYLAMEKRDETDLYGLGIGFETLLEFCPEIEKKPLYFVLYRLRSNLLHSINDRMFSMEYIEKSMDKFKEKFQGLLLDQVLYSTKGQSTEEYIQQIFKECENELIHYFSSDQRIGRTLEDGNKIVEEVSEKIRNSVELGEVATHYRQRLENLIKEGLSEDVLRRWANSYLKEFYEYASQIVSPNHEYVHFEKQFFKTVHQAIVGDILEHGDHEEILSTAYKKIHSEHIKDLFEWMSVEWLRFVNFTVCLRVKDLKADNSFSQLIMHDIEFMSDALFEGWQYNLPFQKKRERTTLVRSSEDEQDDYVWALIHNVRAATNDIYKSYHLATEKLTSCLSLIYFFQPRIMITTSKSVIDS